MKSLKAFISFICYSGAGFVFAEQIVDVKELMNLNPRAQKIIIYLVIIFWVIKIVWFVVDKYWNIQERKQEMRSKEEDIIDKQKD